MADGLSSELGDVGSTSIGAGAINNSHLATGAVSGTAIASGGIGSGMIADGGVPIGAVDTDIGTLKTGSPSVGGQQLQYGTVTATDVAVWTVFGTAFAGAPNLSYGLAVSGAAATHPGCTTTSAVGSFGFLGTSGLTYHWMACGSGRA